MAASICGLRAGEIGHLSLWQRVRKFFGKTPVYHLAPSEGVAAVAYKDADEAVLVFMSRKMGVE